MAPGNLFPDAALPQFFASSIFGTTAEPLNKRPVTNTVLVAASAGDCRSSAAGGAHSTSNFRSDHPGGGWFLFCDGSTRWFAEDTSDGVYRASSTLAGNDNPAF